MFGHIFFNKPNEHMKQLISLSVLALLLATGGRLFAQEDKAEKLLSNYFIAMGGKEALEAVGSSRMLMEGVQEVSGIRLKKEEFRLFGQKFHLKLEQGGQRLEQIFDGQRLSYGGQVIALEESDKALMRSQTYGFTELMLLEQGYGLSFDGLYAGGDFGKPDYYRLTATSPDGATVYTLHYQKDGYKKLTEEMVRTVEVQGGVKRTRITLNFSDYREVDGVQVPFAIEQKDDSGVIQFNVLEAELNPSLPSGVFKI